MQRSPTTRRIIGYQIATLGFYFFYWCRGSRREIDAINGKSEIPSNWLLIVPGLSYWWVWNYAAALEQASRKRVKASDVFLMYLVSFTVFGGSARLFSSTFHTGEPHPDSWHHILIVLGIYILVAALLTLIIGGSIFCNFTQRKIDTARKPIAA